MTTLLLIHGGLWEDMTARRFWQATGIAGGLTSSGFEVLAPSRLVRAPDWAAEASHIAAAAGSGSPMLERAPIWPDLAARPRSSMRC